MLGRDHSLSPASKTVFNLKGWLTVSSKIARAEPISTQNVGLRVQVEMAQHAFQVHSGGVMRGAQQTMPFCHHLPRVRLGQG